VLSPRPCGGGGARSTDSGACKATKLLIQQNAPPHTRISTLKAPGVLISIHASSLACSPLLPFRIANVPYPRRAGKMKNVLVIIVVTICSTVELATCSEIHGPAALQAPLCIGGIARASDKSGPCASTSRAYSVGTRCRVQCRDLSSLQCRGSRRGSEL